MNLLIDKFYKTPSPSPFLPKQFSPKALRWGQARQVSKPGAARGDTTGHRAMSAQQDEEVRRASRREAGEYQDAVPESKQG